MHPEHQEVGNEIRVLIKGQPPDPWLKRQLQAFSAMLTSYHLSCNNVATVRPMSKPAALLIMYPALLISSASVTLLAQFLREEHCLLGDGGRSGMLTWENQDLVVYKSYLEQRPGAQTLEVTPLSPHQC